MNESKDTEHTFARSTDLVLIKPIGSRMEPYTTTDKIAEFAEVSRKAVNQIRVGIERMPVHPFRLSAVPDCVRKLPLHGFAYFAECSPLCQFLTHGKEVMH